MNHIVIFCDKTIKEKYDKIDQTDSILNSKQSLKKQNTKKSKKLLHQMKPQKKKNSASMEVQEIQQKP